MNRRPFRVEIQDWQRAHEIGRDVHIGHHFVYLREGVVVERGRAARLLAGSPEPAPRVLPLLDQPVTAVPGVTISPLHSQIDPLACLVADRDLYRAEQDTVHLFAAMTAPPADLRLVVERNGQPFTERTLDLAAGAGVALEPLAMLLAGEYSARLHGSGRPLGPETRFTVAEYALAPLSARLVSHQLDRASQELSFELAVTSYEVPFGGALDIAIVDAGREIARARLTTSEPGRYVGAVQKLRGAGPFRLRLCVSQDPARIAEVAIPGSRVEERELTVLSELGHEVRFSLMPEPGALPVRGGWLSRGGHHATALRVDEVIARRGRIEVLAALRAVQVAMLDLARGTFTVEDRGDLEPGAAIEVEVPAPGCTVFIGCFAGDRPFEGYTSFLRPGEVELAVTAAATARPGEDLEVRVAVRGSTGPVPVLLSVRDQRLTATDRPGPALAASLKREVDAATAGMDAEVAFVALADAIGGPRPVLAMDLSHYRNFGPVPAPSAPARSSGSETDSFLGAGSRSPILGPASVRQAPPPEVRASFPEVLFHALVVVKNDETIRIPLGQALGTFAIEAFTIRDGDWAEARTELVVDKPVRIDLELPPSLHQGDAVRGRVRGTGPSGRVRIALHRDGEAVALRAEGGREIAAVQVLTAPVELTFDAAPGTYLATVEDAATGETDRVEVEVAEPGRFRSLVRDFALLRAGESARLEAGALSMRVLPGLDRPFRTLLKATADYGHLCCEQTAAKILAAALWYLTGEDTADRAKAAEVIVAGIARERRMFLSGKGFLMYPESTAINPHYSQLATRYLWSLSELAMIADLPPSLRKALEEGRAMADDAGRAHGMHPLPKKPTSMPDAYALAAAGEPARRAEAIRFVRTRLHFAGPKVTVPGAHHRVEARAELAYGAAALIANGELADGLRAANQVTRELDGDGRLYSTVDSVAAIALLVQLRRARLVDGATRIRADGRELTSAAAAAGLSDQIQVVEVIEGAVVVETTRIREEDWTSFHADLPIRVGFRDAGGREVTRFQAGDRVDLAVSLPRGYKAGDLLHVCLPASLAWVRGGGKVKRFSLDFEGKDEIRVPLCVLEPIAGKQHFAVCVRNMFEEERATSPGLLAVSG